MLNKSEDVKERFVLRGCRAVLSEFHHLSQTVVYLEVSKEIHQVTFFFFLNRKSLFIYLFIYLFMAVLGLRFFVRAFSSCGKWGPSLHRGARASHYHGLSCCGAQAPDAQAQ